MVEPLLLAQAAAHSATPQKNSQAIKFPIKPIVLWHTTGDKNNDSDSCSVYRQKIRILAPE